MATIPQNSWDHTYALLQEEAAKSWIQSTDKGKVCFIFALSSYFIIKGAAGGVSSQMLASQQLPTC